MKESIFGKISSLVTRDFLALIRKWSSRHYPFFPTCFAKGGGIYIKDTDGKMYIDACAGYGSVGLGHNHPRILKLMNVLNALDEDGMACVNVVPNAFGTPPLALLLDSICQKFGYDKAVMTNGGAEAIETAIKLMRKWGYVEKRVPLNKARIVVCDGNFHGRTSTIVGFSSESTYRDHFGPYAENAFVSIPYGDADALRRVLEEDAQSVPPTIVGFLVEPIQGEGGVKIPPQGYLKECSDLCKKHNVVFCADEIQTGLGRTGLLLACAHEEVKPDLVVLGKTLGAGKQPVACVLGKEEFMVFEPGEHGSTYGGNATSMALAYEALSIIEDEQLCLQSMIAGYGLLTLLRSELRVELSSGIVRDIRGLGLMIGIELHGTVDVRKVIDTLLRHGVMTKDAHHVIRITPPLVISGEQCRELVKRIGIAFREFALQKTT